MAPIRDELVKQGDDFLWYVSKELLRKFPFSHEEHTCSILDLQYYQSDVIFVPGNEIPYYIKGLKTQIFHGLAGEKKGHFRIRHYFDLYLTQGPYFTKRFNQLKNKYNDFEVKETGWPKLDIYGIEKTKYNKEQRELLNQYNTNSIVLFAPTFSPSLTSVVDLKEEIENLAKKTGYLVLVKFHDLMKPKWIKIYKDLSNKHENIVFIEEKNIVKFLLLADVLISDTSSVIYEFLLLDKPAISYKTISENVKWENLTKKDDLIQSVLKSLKSDPYGAQRNDLKAMYHPYQDGQSAKRMIAATKDYITQHGVPDQRQLPLSRKIKIDSIFGKPISNLWNGISINKISAVLITYNEITNIDAVLTNLQFADEIIVVDSLSTDGTLERIKKRGKVKVIERPFLNFTDQKSYAMSQASNDWVLFMDADERLTDSLKNEILNTVNSQTKTVAFFFYRIFMFQEKVLRYSGWQSDKNYRLFRKSKVNFTTERVVHETLVVDGKIGILKNKLIHFSYKNYQEYKGKMIKYGKMKAQEEIDKNYAPNLYHFLLRPSYKFFNHYILRFGFLDGRKGIIISYLNALGVFARYKELKRLQNPFNSNLSSTNLKNSSTAEIRFLVIQQKMIGDVLASTIICESLKHHFPGAEVHLVANENTLPVLEGNPFVDQVVVFKKEYRDNKRTFFKFLKEIKKTKYSAVIDAYGKLESNLITLFAASNTKIGRRKWYTSWVYSYPIYQALVPDNEIPLSISNRLMLLEPILKENKFRPYPKLYLSSDELQKAKNSIGSLKNVEGKKLLMIGILGSGPDKTYPAKYMASVLDTICDNCDAKLLFNYIPAQKEEALKVYDLCSSETQKQIEIDFYADSLRDFMGVLSQCDMLIGNEGGTVNMAKALGIPSFCFFSPFIVKGAWHGKVYENHESVHLMDYHPELFGVMNKREIKKNIKILYDAFKPNLFKEILINFLKKNCSKL